MASPLLSPQISTQEASRANQRRLAQASNMGTGTSVLMIGGEGEPTLGTPYIDGASVAVEVLEEVKGDKIDVIKFKRRKGYRRKTGHRQRYLKVKVGEISAKKKRGRSPCL